jgi:hypothetical protein
MEGNISLFFFVSKGGYLTPEAKYQAILIKRLKVRFPGCLVLKNDPQYMQGILDLTIFFGPCWAMLEVKAHANAAEQPNQAYYVTQMDNMSFAAFIFPENEEEVLTALSEAFASRGATCLP